MSTTKDDDVGARAFIEELNDIRQIAEMRMMEFDRVRQLERCSPGVSETDVQQAHIEFQSAVAAFVAKLRPYLVGLDIYEQTDLADGDEVVTLADIIARQGQTVEREIEKGDMFDPDQRRTIEVPDLIEPAALRRAVHVLIEQQKQIRFLPQERAVTDVSDDPF